MVGLKYFSSHLASLTQAAAITALVLATLKAGLEQLKHQSILNYGFVSFHFSPVQSYRGDNILYYTQSQHIRYSLVDDVWMDSVGISKQLIKGCY